MRRWLFLLLLAGCATGSSPYASSRCCCQRNTALNAAIGGAVGELLSALLRDPEPAPDPNAPLVPRVRSPDGRVSTHVRIEGGHLKLMGLPRQSREQVVVAVRPLAPLADGCEVRLARDGQPLTIGERLRRTDRELWLTVRLEELAASRHLAGEICGDAFEVDAEGRHQIADFVARFRERAAALPASRTNT